jgi:antitoxin component YwqK of YwqJK toxin-antitoxin module
MYRFLILLALALFFIACNQSGNASEQSATSLESGPDKAATDGYEVTNIENTPAQRLVKRNSEGVIVEEGMLYNGKKAGAWIEYGAEGMFPSKLTTFAEGQYNGTYLEFNARGHITLRATYKNNKLDGPWAAYSFGRVEKQASYKNGELDGTYLEYNRKTGDLQKEIHYKNGKPHGAYRFFDENGNVVLEYEYRNGEKVEGGLVE